MANKNSIANSPKTMEFHRRGGSIIRDAVYAAHDGIITTFAVVAGAAGADLSSSIVIILGFANLFADGLSMAFGNFLGTLSEKRFIAREERREFSEIENVPDVEKEEVRDIFRKWGFEGELLEGVIAKFAENKRSWVDIMMRYELNLRQIETLKPIRAAFVTFFSFFLIGVVPLTSFFLPFFPQEDSFLWSTVLMAISLFMVGAASTIVTGEHFLISGLEVLSIGAVAAFAAYYIGVILRYIPTVV